MNSRGKIFIDDRLRPRPREKKVGWETSEAATHITKQTRRRERGRRGVGTKKQKGVEE